MLRQLIIYKFNDLFHTNPLILDQLKASKRQKLDSTIKASFFSLEYTIQQKNINRLNFNEIYQAALHSNHIKHIYFRNDGTGRWHWAVARPSSLE